jgi:hypothetical protein
MENQLSGPLPCSPENSIAVGHPVWFVHKPSYWHCSPRSNGVWQHD